MVAGLSNLAVGRSMLATLALFPCAAAFMTGPSSLAASKPFSAVTPITAAGLQSFKSPRNSRSRLSMSFVTHYEELTVPTGRSVTLVDITSSIRDIVAKSGCKEGVVTVLSKHSTVSVTINEMEGRLVDDTRQFLLKLAPPYAPYLHNDLDYRVGPSDWPGGDDAWREFRSKEPVNAHSHLIAFVLGTSESIPIHQGEIKIGKYQNVIVVDADGPVGPLGSPKKRTIAVQVMGTK